MNRSSLERKGSSRQSKQLKQKPQRFEAWKNVTLFPAPGENKQLGSLVWVLEPGLFPHNESIHSSWCMNFSRDGKEFEPHLIGQHFLKHCPQTLSRSPRGQKHYRNNANTFEYLLLKTLLTWQWCQNNVEENCWHLHKNQAVQAVVFGFATRHSQYF